MPFGGLGGPQHGRRARHGWLAEVYEVQACALSWPPVDTTHSAA